MTGAVEGIVDGAFRHLMCQLHTDLHILNALVFQAFDGALVTGVQMAGDGTARIDFDLPDADNDRLRALEPALNDAIRQDLAVGQGYVAARCRPGRAGLAAQPLGRAAAAIRRNDPGRRDRRAGSPGLRRHASAVDGRSPCRSAC